MSNYLPQQGMPIIIKGGGKKGIVTNAIQIQTPGDFQITQPFQSQQDDWIQSDSNFSISYVESIMLGQMDENLQFCQTSLMTHPLTFEFKNKKGLNIFTIKEILDSGNYYLQITVVMEDDYFQVTEESESTGAETSNGDWSVSLFNTTDVDLYAVEVTDANDVPVCRLVRANEEDISLNLEPAT
jgi:hypothetical protein